MTNTSTLPIVIAFFLAWASCWLPLAIFCAIAIDWRPPQPLATQQKLPLLASLYLIAPLVLWQASHLLNKSISDYGLVWNLQLISSFWTGLILAVLGLVVIFLLETVWGLVSWNKNAKIASVLLPTLLLAFSISGIEELVFRGFVLTLLQQDFAPVLAAAISSLIFAFLHLLWEQTETIPQLPGLWLMGMVLVLARWVDDGSLGLAWGLHTGWVWAIASLDTLDLIAYTGKASGWVTGKNGKPLAGAAGIVCMLATGAIIWLYHFGALDFGF